MFKYVISSPGTPLLPSDGDGDVLPLGELPKEDVTFTPDGERKPTVLKAKKAKRSREGLAIWFVDGKAWKVYETREGYQDLKDDYTRASNEGLPMGSPRFVLGKVQIGKQRVKEGFVLIVVKFSGKPFQKTDGSFIGALESAEVPKNRNDPDYQRIRAGCIAANTVGLQDCQGFIKTGEREPLRFIDVHTGWNKHLHRYQPSEQAAALLRMINEWATN